jgi:twitching motility protein PilT
MSGYLEKMLDATLKAGGERLVIVTNETPLVCRGGQTNPIMNRPLGEKEIQLLQGEFRRIFAGSERFFFQGRAFQSRAEGDRWELELEPGDTTVAPSLTDLLNFMIQRNASDLHLSTGCHPCLRVDGDMTMLEEYVAYDAERLWRELETVTPERNRKEFQECNDTDFAHELPGVSRFRVNIFRDQRGVAAVFRRIPATIVSASKLDVPSAVIDLCNMPKGLILVTGPTGSGKSTTLAALIDHINRTQQKHVITIEDPVEFVHANKLSFINQREVHTHTESFKKALRAALREDPDVILVGEMRDLETIAIAVEMAVTGHLVFGTLHTATALGTVDRIIDQFPSTQQAQIRVMLADALVGVMAQMLCKRKDGGRVAAYEVLIVTVAVSNIIREGKTFQLGALMQTGKAQGNRLMVDSLSELVEKGMCEAEEAISKSIDKESLRVRLRAKGLLNG